MLEIHQSVIHARNIPSMSSSVRIVVVLARALLSLPCILNGALLVRIRKQVNIHRQFLADQVQLILQYIQISALVHLDDHFCTEHQLAGHRGRENL